MQRAKPPFRADHVGSLLRTAPLKAAREKRKRGEIDAAALAEIEDREIEGVIRKQEAAGLKAVTDGECRRISIFLSVFDIHVQNSPVAGKISYFHHAPGQYMNAMRTDCAQFNENVLLGIEAAEPRGEKIGVRLIAGLIARRIVPWIQLNDAVQRGERISLIQFGSRVDVYLPKHAKIKVNLCDKVIGGETVIASFD